MLECTRNFHSSVYEGRKFCFRFGVFFFDVIAVAESSSSSVSCVLFLLEDMTSRKNMAYACESNPLKPETASFSRPSYYGETFLKCDRLITETKHKKTKIEPNCYYIPYFLRSLRISVLKV